MDELVVQEELRPAWDQVGLPGEGLRGLAGAAAAGRGAAVVVTGRALSDPERTALAGELAGLLGVGQVELAGLDATDLPALLRQWVNQAAQGSGRGVQVRVEEDGFALRVLVQAIDSSARELAMRLASHYEPALPALRALLGRPITVEDAETASPA